MHPTAWCISPISPASHPHCLPLLATQVSCTTWTDWFMCFWSTWMMWLSPTTSSATHWCSAWALKQWWPALVSSWCQCSTSCPMHLAITSRSTSEVIIACTAMSTGVGNCLPCGAVPLIRIVSSYDSQFFSKDHSQHCCMSAGFLHWLWEDCWDLLASLVLLSSASQRVFSILMMLVLFCCMSSWDI